MNIKTTIENGKFLIPKGYYQIFGDTIIQEGDLWIESNNEYKDEWLDTYILKEDNRTVAGEQFKEPSIVYIRKIEDPKEVTSGRIPDGWIKIDSTEILKEGDYFLCRGQWEKSYDFQTNNRYSKDNFHLCYIRQIHQPYIIFPNKKVENKDSNINNQNMNNNIEELKALKAKLEQQIIEAEKAEQQKEEMNNLVAGDYVVCLDNTDGFTKNALYIFKEYHYDFVAVELDDYNSTTNAWHKRYFRKATNEEVNQHLLKTFKVGDYITRIDSEKWNNYQESWPIGKAVKITKISITEACARFVCEKDWRTGVPDGWVLYPFRKATKTEIEEYKNKFEKLAIGSYIIYLKDTSDQFTKNNLYKIVGYNSNMCGYYEVEKDDKGSSTNGFFFTLLNKQYRAATPEEVENWEKKIKEEKEIKVGDYVVALSSTYGGGVKTDNIYQIIEVEGKDHSYLRFINSNNNEDGWCKKFFRKATIQEIEQHLRDEAAKNGFVIGANVQWGNSGTVFPIEKIEFYKEFDDIKNMSGAYVSKQNFLIVRGKHQLSFEHSAEICEKLKLVEDTISINGYDAKYFERYIKFGCAEISITMLRQLKDMYICGGYGNRKLEGSVMIGKGEFDKEIIKKLLDNHNKKFG